MNTMRRSLRLVLLVCLVAAFGSSGLPASVAEAGGPQWWPIGSAGFTTAAAYTDIAISPQGIPYVVFDDVLHGQKAKVMSYGGASWHTVGNANFSDGLALETCLAVDAQGTPYVAYIDEALGSKATVMKLAGDTWQPVGQKGFSTGSIEYPSLAVDSHGTLYLAYQDSGAAGKATVMKFDGTAWQALGTPGLSDGRAHYTSLAISHADVPYVAYVDHADDATGGRQAAVKRYDSVSGWQTVGSTSPSGGQSLFTSVALDSQDRPYLAFRDISNGDTATVVRLNDSNAWEYVGQRGFSGVGAVSYVRLVMDQSNTPYVSYKDGGSGDRVTAMYFDGLAWGTMGTAGFSDGKAEYPSLALDPAGIPYVAYRDLAHGTGPTVQRFSTEPPTLPRVVLVVDQADQPGFQGWYNRTSSGTDGIHVSVTASTTFGRVTHLKCVDSSQTVLWDADGATGAFDLQEGQHSIVCNATNTGGDTGAGIGSTNMPAQLNVDQSLPLLNPRVEPNPALRYGPAQALAGASDAISGIYQETCAKPDTSTVGHYSISCTAVDNAGNSATGATEYDVIPSNITPTVTPEPSTTPEPSSTPHPDSWEHIYMPLLVRP